MNEKKSIFFLNLGTHSSFRVLKDDCRGRATGAVAPVALSQGGKSDLSGAKEPF